VQGDSAANDHEPPYLFFNIKHRCSLRHKTAIGLRSHTTMTAIQLSRNRGQQGTDGNKKSEIAIQHDVGGIALKKIGFWIVAQSDLWEDGGRLRGSPNAQEHDQEVYQ
jgi:hypothetical protein